MPSPDELFTNPAYAKLTPANFAIYTSGGRWRMAKHLALLNRELVEIASGRNKRLLVSMPPRPQPIDSRILMADGRYKPLANVEVGDEVISHKGIKRKVLEITDAGMQPIVNILSSRGVKIKLAETHRVGIEDQGWKEARHILPEDRLVTLYNVTLEYPTKLDMHLAFSLGLCTSTGKRTLKGEYKSPTFNTDKIPAKYKENNPYVDIRSKGIYLTDFGNDEFNKLGWKGNGQLLGLAHNLDPETFIHYLFGTLCAENRAGNFIRIINGSAKYIEDLHLMLLNYGVLSCCSYTDRGNVLNIFLKPQVAYIKDIFNQVVTSRPQAPPMYISHKIKTIVYSEPEPCICLTVEGDSSYISEGYVSHNSGKCVDEDQEVFKCDGTPIKIKDIQVGEKVISLGSNGVLHKDTVVHKVDSGKKECYEVALLDGKKVISTEDHKFLTTDGYKAVKDLKPNVHVAITPYPTPDKNIRWVRLNKITKVGLRPTFDLQISDYNNFVVNGVVVHNSELVSKYFPAWYLGAFPNNQLIFSTYESHFAAEFGGAARDLLTEYGPEVFGVNVREGSAAASRWKIEDRLGVMQCAGVGGPLTGKGADCLIIDDPIKNDQEAESLLMRNKIFNWFGATASTRLMPGGSIVIVMTRWHCLLPGNKVLCKKGYKKIEDVEQWDEVFGSTGYCKVLAKKDKYTEDEIYSFKLFANPDELCVTSDHRIYTDKGWKQAKDITSFDMVFCPKPIKKYDSLDFLIRYSPGREKGFDYSALKDPEFWYCVGLWVAEGCLTYGRKTGNSNSVRYTLNANEENIILKVKEILLKYGVNLNYSIKGNTLQAKATNYHLARILENFGTGALNKYIPEFVYSLDRENLIQFLKGMYIGDGCLHEKYLRITSSSLSLLQGIRLCLLLLDCPSSIMYVRKEAKKRIIRGKECNVNKSWELRTVCNEIKTVVNPINFESIRISPEGCYFNIKHIKKLNYSGLVYDIQTESSDFLSEGILVHNCDDLIGRLLEKMKNEDGETYKYLKFPAIASEQEEPWPKGLGRSPGEALWPDMWPIESLNKIKNSGALSSYYWSALYQQEPAPEGGGIFKEKWFRYFKKVGDYYLLEDGQGNTKFVEDNKCWKLVTVDTANKVTETSDYTAIGVWAITPDNDILLVHLVRDRIGYEKILKELISINTFFRPRYIGIENMGIAIQLIIEARNKQLPVRELEPEGKGKQNRANMPLGAVIRMENGKIYFPKDAPYRNDIELELMTFPKARNDEIVDILSYACNEITKLDMYENSDFLPYSLDQALPVGMRKQGGFGINF